MEVDVLDALDQAVERLLSCDSFVLADKETMVRIHRLSAKFDCAKALAAFGFDEGAEWVSDGAQTSSAWVDTRCHVPKKEAKKLVRLGRSLSYLPVLKEAWADGAIGLAQVEVLCGLKGARSEAAFCRDEEMLVEQAKTMKFASFCWAAAYWEQLADPDGASEADMERRERRDAYLSPSANGTWCGKMTLDQVSGTVVSTELVRLEQELFEADWAGAKEALGRDPKSHELARTPAQRRADALVEMAIRSATAPADGRRPAPLVSIYVGWETLHGRLCQLSNGLALSPDTVLGQLNGADLERAVFGPGKRVEVGITSRFFTGATRRAIELRDQECSHAYCDVPAERCQIDHITEASKGGLTNQENGRVMCGFHNRQRNGRPPPEDEWG
jgi:hypothetical protein